MKKQDIPQEFIDNINKIIVDYGYICNRISNNTAGIGKIGHNSPVLLHICAKRMRISTGETLLYTSPVDPKYAESFIKKFWYATKKP